jgi:hypothetical protein
MAKGAGAGAAAWGALANGSAAGVEDPIPEMILVKSPGPELIGGAGGAAGGAGVGSTGAWASLRISRVTPPAEASPGSEEIGGEDRGIGSGR